jgi:hypothetical protein
MVLDAGPRRKDEISPRQLAKHTGNHIETVRRWCRAAHDGRTTPITGVVRRDATGHYWISRDAIDGRP